MWSLPSDFASEFDTRFVLPYKCTLFQTVAVVRF